MDEQPEPLAALAQPPARVYDVALLDLDGVVYLGPRPVPGAADALAAARAMGMRLAFVTNNAARPPDEVAEHLSELGVPASADDVITSSQAAARSLVEQLGAGAKILVVGTTGLEQALVEQGLTPVFSADDEPAAVVQGYSPTLNWAQLAEGAVAIRRGLPWVATNLDATVPSERGPLPGNGSLVAALRHATGRTPTTTGKPEPTMHRESVLRSHAQRPLVVGDRLDTDIEGAQAVGSPSLLVLTGVTDVATLLRARPEQRPTLVAKDLRGLLEPHPGVRATAAGFACGRFRASVEGDGSALLESIAGASAAPQDELDALRALCRLAWQRSDEGHPPGSVVRAQGEAARTALQRLALPERQRP